MISLRVATYNVHKCRGMDLRVNLGRTLAVLQQLDSDIVAVQEIFEQQALSFADRLAMDFRFAGARQLAGEAYGNAVFSRLPLGDAVVHDLTIAGREPRNCIGVRIDLDEGHAVHLFALHLGTSFFERRKQAERLLAKDVLDGSPARNPRIVLGDFNEWTRGLVTHSLSNLMKNADVAEHLGRGRTYPGMVPFLHLDHIYYDEPLRLHQLRLHRTIDSLLASDHLPLVADFQL
jgi:endonuclease/exonuclease/phosphatase family metal-dependent hydrolase